MPRRLGTNTTETQREDPSDSKGKEDENIDGMHGMRNTIPKLFTRALQLLLIEIYIISKKFTLACCRSYKMSFL